MRGTQLLLSAVVAVLLGALLFWDGSEHRVETKHHYTVGVIALTEVDAATLRGFKKGMEKLGYIEGENIRYLSEGPAHTIERLDEVVRRTLAHKLDLVFVSSTPATLKVQELTRGQPLPVIFDPVNEPVGAGIVQSLKHPGGNITGIKLPTGDKLRLQWLTELAPDARRVYFPYNPVDKSALATLAEVEEALPLLGLELVKAPMGTPQEVADALADFPAGVDAIFLPRDSSIEAQIALFVAVAKQHRLPLSAPSLTQVEAGALYTYGFIHYEFGRQAARLADQIFHGVKPADIPVEVAKNYLALNLATAEAIGLTIPDALLRRTDRIIR